MFSFFWAFLCVAIVLRLLMNRKPPPPKPFQRPIFNEKGLIVGWKEGNVPPGEKSGTVLHNSGKEPTEKQLETLLRITDNRLTAKKFSEATGFTEKKSKRYLDKLVVDSKLSVEAGDEELVYYR
jgi:hypothetical protein